MIVCTLMLYKSSAHLGTKYLYVHTCYSRRRAVSAPPPPPGPGQGRPGLVSPPGLISAVTQFSWARSLVLKDLGRRGRAGDSASAKSGYNPGPGTIMIYLRGSQSRAATNFVYRRGVALACETYHALLLHYAFHSSGSRIPGCVTEGLEIRPS